MFAITLRSTSAALLVSRSTCSCTLSAEATLGPRSTLRASVAKLPVSLVVALVVPLVESSLFVSLIEASLIETTLLVHRASLIVDRSSLTPSLLIATKVSIHVLGLLLLGIHLITSSLIHIILGLNWFGRSILHLCGCVSIVRSDLLLRLVLLLLWRLILLLRSLVLLWLLLRLLRRLVGSLRLLRLNRLISGLLLLNYWFVLRLLLVLRWFVGWLVLLRLLLNRLYSRFISLVIVRPLTLIALIPLLLGFKTRVSKTTTIHSPATSLSLRLRRPTKPTISELMHGLHLTLNTFT